MIAIYNIMQYFAETMNHDGNCKSFRTWFQILTTGDHEAAGHNIVELGDVTGEFFR